MCTEALPAPFLKWAGGKRQIVPRILREIPGRIETYYEPFVGGGAVFFALAREPELRFKRAVLADANQELVRCYQTIKSDVDGVIRELRRHRYDRASYYELREKDPDEMPPAARAARLIYLNRCGYNGLYRVNSRGLFNVPFGRYKRVLVCDEPRLRAASQALRRAEIVAADFEEALASVTERDFVYLDPPYVPLSSTSSFTAYARAGFDDDDQRRLARLLRRLGDGRVPALLSNSDCAFTRRLYRGLRPEQIQVRRAINSVGSARGAIPELLVRSFPFDHARGPWKGPRTLPRRTPPGEARLRPRA